MKQYFDIKAKHPDAILLFRVGDFYEMYGEDAVTGAEILGIVQTKKANGPGQTIEMAGFPHHALDSYLPKLVRAGKRVAICDQLEDPKLTKKLVKRGITELVTPGVSINDNILNHKENNFLAAIHFGKDVCGIAFLDISTGEFLTAEGTVDYVDKLLNNFSPKEVLVERGSRKRFEEAFGPRFFIFELDDWVFTSEAANDRLLKHFETKNLKGFGVQHLKLGVVASGAILYYLDQTQHTHISHITSLSRIEEDRYVRLDKFTVRSLELVSTMNEEGTSLLDVLDKTVSPMGSRMLRRWILFPLKDVKPIHERQDVVEYFFRHPEVKELLEEKLEQIGDLERIISKVAVGRVSPREVVQLKVALRAIEPIKEACTASDEPSLCRIGEQLNACALIRDRIEKEINNDPAYLLNRGGVIATGVNAELDELRAIAYSGKDYLLKVQQREIEQTGISSLKIGFNNVFGYYIEVRNAYKDKVPAGWIRKQTLVNAERYITEELKEYEEKILGAEEKILSLEARLFNELVLCLCEYIPPIQMNANLIGRLDCLLSFAKVAESNRYIRPDVNDSQVIDIKAGRHPVIEKQLPIGEPYIANDVYLDDEKQQIIIITGPNMAGKSTYMRQTALIVLMAQIGCFVPARSANIGIVDRIFTRVGASDDLSAGQSTFMVEMTEVANILHNATNKSLLILDEIGRGTSTFDGLSIAWAVLEYIADTKQIGAKTLFATHYHELSELEGKLSGVKNYCIAVQEQGEDIIFLRKIQRGGADHSYGVQVARLAGLPNKVIRRSGQILKQLNAADITKKAKQIAVESKEQQEETAQQMDMFHIAETQLADEISKLDVMAMTPIEALQTLFELQKKAKGL